MAKMNTLTHHPAENGEPRYGVIRKELRIYSPSDWGTCNATHSVVGISIDTFEHAISVVCLMGSMPYAENLFLALLADRDIRREIVEYQERGRFLPYKIWQKIGMSDCRDIFLTLGKVRNGFAVTTTKKLAHISCFGRLNEGFAEEEPMYIGDFVEMCSFLGLTQDMNVKRLRKRAGVKYIRPRFEEEVEDFETSVSKIL